MMLSWQKGEVDSANGWGLARVGEFYVFQFNNGMLRVGIGVLLKPAFRVGFRFFFDG